MKLFLNLPFKTSVKHELWCFVTPNNYRCAKSKQSKKPRRRINENIYRRNSILFPPFDHFFSRQNRKCLGKMLTCLFSRFMLWCSQVFQWSCKQYNSCEYYRSAHTHCVCIVTLSVKNNFSSGKSALIFIFPGVFFCHYNFQWILNRGSVREISSGGSYPVFLWYPDSSPHFKEVTKH